MIFPSSVSGPAAGATAAIATTVPNTNTATAKITVHVTKTSPAINAKPMTMGASNSASATTKVMTVMTKKTAKGGTYKKRYATTVT